MVVQSEISFIAMCLLDRFQGGLQRIYCDTPGIMPVAYTLCKLKELFGGTLIPIKVDSFGSYPRLRDFEFSDLGRALILISSSTSGNLVKKLQQLHNVDPDSTITLYYLSSSGSQYPILSNLTETSNFHATPHTPIKSYDADECPLCRAGSMELRILGENFFPGEPDIRACLIDKKDAPKWLGNFMEYAAEHSFISSFKSPYPGQPETMEVCFDFQKMLTSSFRNALESLIKKRIPADVTLIIAASDPDSMAMKEAVLKVMSPFWKKEPEIAVFDASTSKLGNCPSNPSTIVVLVPIVSTGTTLLGVSRELRSISKHAHILYIIGLSRTTSEQSWKDLVSHVQMGKRMNQHAVEVCESIYLSQVSSPNAWDKELIFLKELRAVLGNTSTLKKLLDDRIHALNKSGSLGLTDNVFWSNQSGTILKLRDTFVFAPPSTKGTSFTQADVLFSIGSILHNLRIDSRKRLGQAVYRRSVLCPRNFERYNDGIVQAALLRAANEVELDYSESDENSRKILSILTFLLTNWNNSHGEGLTEFIVAIGSSRLRLTESDESEICNKASEKKDLPIHLVAMFNFIKSRLHVKVI